MPKLPVLSGYQVIKVLEKNGFVSLTRVMHDNRSEAK